MVRNWTVFAGLFSSPGDWSPAGTPVAGDTLYIQRGLVVMVGQTFGSPSASTAISLIGDTAASAPMLALVNDTLRNVVVSNTPAPFSGPTAPPDYYSAKYGTVLIGGKVVNDGGTIEASRGSRVGGNNLSVLVQPGSTLVNKGTLLSGPNSQLTISGSSGGTVENDGKVVAGGGHVTISAHLTGTGDAYVKNAGVGLDSRIEVNAAVDAGQTVHIEGGALQLDQPTSFLGQVEVPSAGVLGGVLVEGLSPASWDVKGNLLELSDSAGARLDTLRFTTPETQSSLAVYERPDATYGNTVLVSSSNHPPGGTVVPYHTNTV